MKSTIIRKATKAYANYKINYPEADPEFPGFMLCSYQGHSRRKVIEKYPQMNSTHLYGLYGSNPEFQDIPELSKLDLQKFHIDTRQDIRILGCSIGEAIKGVLYCLVGSPSPDWSDCLLHIICLVLSVFGGNIFCRNASLYQQVEINFNSSRRL